MRTALLTTGALLVSLSAVAGAQAAHAAGHPGPDQRATRQPTGDAALVANALSAAPPAVAKAASVVGHDGRELRRGTNGWVCMPDMPDVPNNTPMCLDAAWRAFIDAWMNKRSPNVTQVGFGYMLQGDMPVSNVDPFATGPTSTNQWIQHGGPHVMVLVPDARVLDGISSDPTHGGPFVMWKGTPYAHIMVPTTAAPK